MMKKVAMLMAVLMLAMAMFGCSSTPATEAAPAAEAPSAQAAAPAAAEPAAEPAAAKPYEIAYVVKQAGAPWFQSMGLGVDQAAIDFGVNAYQVGPADADAAQQVQMVDDLIAKGSVDAIVVCPTDIESLKQSFLKAQEKGIKILTHEAPNATKDYGVDWDVESVQTVKYAKIAMDFIAEKAGGKGGYVLFVGGLSVPLHNIFADLVLEYQKEAYPDMWEITTRFPCGESVEDGYANTMDLIQAYGDDFVGVMSFGSLGTLGAAAAVRDTGNIGKIFVCGNVTPNTAAEYLADGSLAQGIGWYPYESGYYGIYAAIQEIEGKLAGQTELIVEGDDVSAVIDGLIIQFDTNKIYTKENVSEYDF